MKKTIAAWWPTVLVFAVILYATLNENPIGAEQLPSFPGADKLVHAIMFGGLFSAITFDRCRAGLNIGTKVLVLTAVACVLCGALDEICQSTLTTVRDGDVLDLFADTAGIAIAFFAAPPAIRAVLRK